MGFFLYGVAGLCHGWQGCVLGERRWYLCGKSNGGRDTKTIINMEAEKVYCMDGARNSDALAYAAMANNKGSDPMAMAAMMNGGMGGGWNNPFAYMMMLGMFRFMYGDGWNNGGGKIQDAEIQAKLNALQNQMSDNHNTDLLMDAVKGNGVALGQLAQSLNCDFNQLQNAVCGIQAAVQQVGGQVGFSAERVINAANLGDLNIVQQLKDCCCQTQQNIIRMGYENQLGQKDLQNSIQQGFSYANTGVERAASNLGYQMSQLGCDLKTNANQNTQRIIDTLNGHWQEDLQLRLNRAEMELSQQRQNATLIAALGTKTTTTTA